MDFHREMIARHGTDAQALKVLEEASEFVTAMIQYRNNQQARNRAVKMESLFKNLLGEAADLYLVAQYIPLIWGEENIRILCEIKKQRQMIREGWEYGGDQDNPGTGGAYTRDRGGEEPGNGGDGGFMGCDSAVDASGESYCGSAPPGGRVQEDTQRLG